MLNQPNLILLLLWALTWPVAEAAEVGRVQANAPLVATPTAYTVVAVPDNWKTDPLCQDLVNGFKQDPTLLALRGKTKIYTYTASNPDWKHRWAARVPQLPTVIIMQDNQVLYKRSGVGAQPIVQDCLRSGILQRLRPCTPDRCPPQEQPYQPYQPNQPYTPPNTVLDQPSNPNSPLQPAPVGPQIPDTPVTPYVPPQPQPQQPVVVPPPVDLTPIAEGQTTIVNELKATNDVQQKVLVAIQQLQPPDLTGVENRLDVIAAAQATMQTTINNLPVPQPPVVIPPQTVIRQPLFYVTSKQWCSECAQVTAKVEQVRNANKVIAIVELDGLFTNPPRSFNATGIPAIHDFSTGRSIVGAEACLAFLSELEKE